MTRCRPSKPHIPDPAEWRPRRQFGYCVGRVVVGLSGHVIERRDPQVDLPYLKTSYLDAEIEPEQREVLELLRQQLVVPAGNFGQPVVGDHEGACLGRGQVIEAQGRHLGNAELAAGEQSPVPGDHLELGIDQHRHVEAKALDAVGDLPGLLFAVQPRVGGVRFQRLDPTIYNRQIKTRHRCVFSISQA